ncbi:hypothetical protein [Clostridium ihumii]|uniref:hypothetical protein n=1 Tax=Clostridium ihumii TaxID=1470356 RepID=UPI003D351994
MLDTIEVEINELFDELITFAHELIEEKFISDIVVNDLNIEDLNRNFDKFIFNKGTNILKDYLSLIRY